MSIIESLLLAITFVIVGYLLAQLKTKAKPIKKSGNLGGYVAGSYSDVDDKGVNWNIHKARELSLNVIRRLYKYNVRIFTPHLNSANFHKDLKHIDLNYWYTTTLDAMLQCDFVIVVPEYKKSEGTINEIKVAKKNNIPVFYDLRTLTSWVKGQQ